MQPQSHTFLQGEKTMLSKAWSIVAHPVTAPSFFSVSAQAQVQVAALRHILGFQEHCADRQSVIAQ
jgi:hypothetical protein